MSSRTLGPSRDPSNEASQPRRSSAGPHEPSLSMPPPARERSGNRARASTGNRASERGAGLTEDGFKKSFDAPNELFLKDFEAKKIWDILKKV